MEQFEVEDIIKALQKGAQAQRSSAQAHWAMSHTLKFIGIWLFLLLCMQTCSFITGG